MAGPSLKSSPSFGSGTAAVFVFNLIVGTGALALPAAFAAAGWAAGTVLLLVLALASYITATWVVEAMAACNAIIRIQVWLVINRRNSESITVILNGNFLSSIKFNLQSLQFSPNIILAPTVDLIFHFSKFPCAFNYRSELFNFTFSRVFRVIGYRISKRQRIWRRNLLTFSKSLITPTAPTL